MEPFKLTQPEIKRLNDSLADLEVIMSDMEVSKSLGVPNMDEMIAGCEECSRIIKAYKSAFAKDKS
jgi:hypothetical protein